MKRFASLFVVALSCAAASAQDILPIITGSSENAAGTQITITGSGFGAALAAVPWPAVLSR